MPIMMEDPYGNGQPEIKLGQSKLPVRETYSASPGAAQQQYGEKMQEAHQLTQALASLSHTFKEQNEKAQALANKEYLLNLDLNTGGAAINSSGGSGGVASRSYPGFGSPDGAGFSPSADIGTRMVGQHRMGEVAFQRVLEEDPVIRELNANEALKTDPASYNKALGARINELLTKTQSPYGNETAVGRAYLGGAASVARKFSDSASSEAFTKSIEESKKVNLQAARQEANGNMSTMATQQAAAAAVQAQGGDVGKLYQYAAIENPKWDNNAVSSNGSTGITQINDARWDDIKKDMKANGQGDLADRLVDRRDAAQNATAWNWEYQKNFKQAQSVLGRDPTTAETYMYWQVPALAGRILSNQDAKVSDVVPANVIKANPIVYGNGQMTVREMLGHVNQVMNRGSDMHTEFHPVNTMERRMITQETWQDNLTKSGYKWSDFKNSGVYGGPGQIDSRAIYALDQLSQFMGRKIGVNSAHRSEEYNLAVTGTNTGNHPAGDALDINITKPEEQLKAAQFLASIGARGIELTQGHVHFDFATARPGQTEDVRVFTSRDNPVSPELLSQAKQAVAAGRASMVGNQSLVVRTPGFQGKPLDPMEIQIRNMVNKYGIAPSVARTEVFKLTTSAAENKAFAGDAAGAHLDLSNARKTFGAISAEEELELNKAHQTVNEIQNSLRSRKEQQDQFEAKQALDSYIKKAEDQNKADPSKPLSPRQEDFPQTVAGIHAYKAARELGLNITQVDEATSQGNLLQIQSELAGDPTKVGEKLGFSDWTKATPTEVRQAVYTKLPGQFTPSDVAKVMEAYEGARRALPVAQNAAVESAKLNAAEIKAAFESQSHAIKAISNANMAGTGTLNDPWGAKTEVERWVNRTTEFYKENYAARYQAALRDNNGVPLSGDQKNALSQAALQSTNVYAKTLADQIVANKAELGKSTKAALSLQHPAQRFEEEVMNGEVKRLEGRGYVVTNIKYPGVPPGSVLQFDEKTRRPLMTPNGSYMMLTPSNQPFYFKPDYNVMPDPSKAVPGPISQELTPPASQPAQQAQSPQVDLNGPASVFLSWLKSHGVSVPGT